MIFYSKLYLLIININHKILKIFLIIDYSKFLLKTYLKVLLIISYKNLMHVIFIFLINLKINHEYFSKVKKFFQHYFLLKYKDIIIKFHY